MSEIKVTFSDSSVVTFHEGQILGRYVSSTKQDIGASIAQPCTLEEHPEDGLVPSFLEVLFNSEFFYDINEDRTYYSSKSVSKIEII